jgi:hypothetical protein
MRTRTRAFGAANECGSYIDAIASALHTTIEGVDIPFVSLPVLISSKDTYREQDRLDVQHLRALLARQGK